MTTMPQIYKTSSIDSAHDFFVLATKGDLPSVQIANASWGGDYMPCAKAYLCPDYKSGGLRVLLIAEENPKDIRAVETEFNGRVWEDSCLEFFFNPCPENGLEYINLELNSLGSMLCGIHTAGFDGFIKDRNAADFDLRVVRQPLSADLLRWSVSFFISFDFIKSYFPKFQPRPGMTITGNFYKCGDFCPTKHYISAFPVMCELPNFHRPESFGKIVL